MVLSVYGYLPAWGLPDISPYVTKLIFFLKMTGTQYVYKEEDLTQLDANAPKGKLPYVIDDDGTKIGDSNEIIAYLEKKHGITLDKSLSPADRALSLAWERLFGEHLYWSGIIEARWRLDDGFKTYIPYLVGDVEITPELQGFLDMFRARIVGGFNGQGMGRRSHENVLETYKIDIDAVSDWLGDKKYWLGDEPHNIDAMACAMLRHCTDQPHKWPGTGYLEGKAHVVAYLDRMRKEYGL